MTNEIATIPESRLVAQQRAIDEARETERVLSAEVTRLLERVADVDARIEATAQQRRVEKQQAQPRIEALAACDAETARLQLEREAAKAALEHAGRCAEDAKRHRIANEATLRGLHERIRQLRDALPELRSRLAQTERQIAQTEHGLVMMNRRRSTDQETIAAVEREIDEIGKAPESTAKTVYPRWLERLVND